MPCPLDPITVARPVRLGNEPASPEVSAAAPAPAFRVITLITPNTAFVPKSEDPGPRTTSM